MLKPGPVWAAGTMSGTSLDGVDAAMVLTDGTRILDFGRTDYRPYSEAEQEVLRAALGLWPGEPGVEAAAEVVETAHAELLAGMVDARVIGLLPVFWNQRSSMMLSRWPTCSDAAVAS